MNGSETSAPRLAHRASPFFGGFAFALAAFLTFHRFDIGAASARAALGFAAAAVLAGCSVGASWQPPRRANAAWLALAAAVLWAWLALAPLGGNPLWTAVSAVAAFGLMCGLTGGGRPFGEEPFVAGAIVGSAACSAGLMAAAGVAIPVIAAAIAAAICGGVSVRVGSAREENGIRRASAPLGASRLLLALAVGATVVTVMRAYLPAVRSLAYSACDVAIPLFAGGLVAARLGRGFGRGPVALVAGCIVVLLTAVLSGFSFFLYPDLILSEAAAAQTPAHLLTASRVFPVWLLAFALGVAAGPALISGKAGRHSGLPLMAMAAGAAATGLLGAWYQVGSVIAAALVLLALLPVCFARRDFGLGTGRMLPLAAAGLALVCLLWSVSADPYMGCPGVRRAVADYQETPSEASAQAAQQEGFGEFLRAEADRLADRPDALARSGSLGSAAARLESRGLMVRFRGDGVYAELLNGGVVAMELGGRGVGSNPVNLAVALGMAFSAPPERVGLLCPVLEATAETAARAAGGAHVSVVSLWDGSGTGEMDVVICGPGPLSSTGNPLAILSRQGLRRVREGLTEQGVFSLWLPVGRLSLPTLQSAVTTFSEAFPSFLVFLIGREAVLVGTDAPQLRFDNMELLRPRVDDAGFWDVLELVGDFAADADDLRSLSVGTRPYRLSHPCRPPALGRDLLRRPNAVSLAALAQHRAAGPGRLLDRLRFRSQNQRAVALRGFGAIYQARTRGILQDVGRASFAREDEFLGFLRGPLAQLELFASGDQGSAVRMGAALSAFGLREAAVEEFQAAIAEGRGSCTVHRELAGVLEELDRFTEALYHYRKAVDQDPQSEVARGRLTALLLGMGRHREAAAALRDTIERDPENVAALLKLAGLYAGTLNRPDDAARLASKVLETQPGNAFARELLALTRRPPGGDAGQ